VITKHGKAVAKLVPIPPEQDLFGALTGSVLAEDDLISPVANEWEACQ
jgi:antitoxin (DNA-binding transcriptional repressor) of toxin-antitoxin stability system